MGVIEKAATASALDLDRFRLRRFVESLGADELETRSEPVDLADVAAALEGNACAVHFRAAGPERAEIVEISRAEAPVQQVVLTGDDADLTALPVHLQHGFDGGPYISASIDYVIDPRSGWTNVGIRRLMLRGRRETGVDLVSPSDLKAIYE